MSELEGHIQKAIQNINSDREAAAALLNAGLLHLQSKGDHVEIGQQLAKYVETLQRSNEQYVKLIGIMNKNTEGASRELDDDDRHAFFFGDDDGGAVNVG